MAIAPLTPRMGSSPFEGGDSGVFPQTPSLRGLVQRMLGLAVLFASELIAVSVWLDTASLGQAGLSGIMRSWGSWILRSIVCFAVIFVTVAYLKNKAGLARISAQVEQTPIRGRLLAAHAFAMMVFAALSSFLYGGFLYGGFLYSGSIHAGRGSESLANSLAASWLLAGIAAIAFAGLAFLPWMAWVQLVRQTGYLWAYSLLAVIAACGFGKMCQWLWQPASRLTFGLTKLFLSPFVSSIVTNPARMGIGTEHFRVRISPECSGLEGVGLMLSFGILWLIVFRKECRFPQSLLLIPAGVVLLFLLNSVRIAALILIGSAGARQIALGGFHSQAGWIAFSAVSVGFCFVSQQVPWFTTRQWVANVQLGTPSFAAAGHNPTAAFLLPFAAILAAGMIAAAAAGTGSGSVEWLYPLRFIAGAVALWIYRRSYADLDWRCDWLAPAIGAIVFGIWIALDRSSNATADNGISTAFMASPMIARVSWIVMRVLAAVVTVPLAEELAFRGFLMRRLVSADFETVPFRGLPRGLPRRLSWFALLGSSLVFGFLHGGYWIAGIIAGILFGLAVIRRGRIGDAVVAHATANALLAAYVLTYHKWHLW